MSINEIINTVATPKEIVNKNSKIENVPKMIYVNVKPSLFNTKKKEK